MGNGEELPQTVEESQRVHSFLIGSDVRFYLPPRRPEAAAEPSRVNFRKLGVCRRRRAVPADHGSAYRQRITGRRARCSAPGQLFLALCQHQPAGQRRWPPWLALVPVQCPLDARPEFASEPLDRWPPCAWCRSARRRISMMVSGRLRHWSARNGYGESKAGLQVGVK